MAKDEVKIKFMAETSEFRGGIKSANNTIKTLNSALKLNSTQMKANSGDVNLLKERQNLLSTQLQKSQEKVELTSQKLEKAKEIYGKDSEAVKQYESELNNAKSQEEAIRQRLVDTNTEIEKQNHVLKQSALEEYDKSAALLDSDISTLNSALQLNSTQLKANSGDVNLLKERQNLLSTELQKSQEKVELTSEKLEKAKEIYGEDSEAVQRYKRDLNNAKNQEAEIRQQLIDTNVELENQKNVLNGVDEKLQSFGESVSGVGTKLTVGVTAPILAAGTSMGKMSLSFEDNMANINTLLDNDTHLESYKSATKSLSDDTGINIATMSSGMYQAISSLGDGGKEIENIFGTMATAAKAGKAEVSDSVALISAGMKGYNSINNETAQKISDLAFQTAKLGVTTFPEMAKSMQPLFPLANSLNLSYEDLFGSMATLTGVTGNTAEVSTQLKAVFSKLMKPTKSMQSMIEKYGYSSGQAMIESEGFAGTLKIIQNETEGQADKMARLFSSTEAVTAMTALTGAQFDTFNDKLEQMSGATGSTETAYQKLETKGESLRKSVNQIKNTGLELGDSLMDVLSPVIESASEKVSGFSDWFSSLDCKQKETIVTIGAVVAAIGPGLVIIGKVSSGIGKMISLYNGIRGAIIAKTAVQAAETIATTASTAATTAETTATGAATVAQTGLNTAMLACPLTWIVIAIVAVIAVIAGLVLGFKTAYEKCEWFREGVDKIKEGLVNFGNKVSEVKDKAVQGFKNLVDGGKEYLGSLKSTYEENGGGIKGIVATVTKFQHDKFKAGYNALNTLTGGKLGEIVDITKEKYTAIKTAAADKLKGVVSDGKKYLGSLKSTYEENGGGLKGIVKATMKVQKDYFKAGYDAINKLSGGKLDALKSTVQEKMSAVHEKYKSVVDKIKKVFDFKLSLPSIKMPSLSVTWKQEGNLVKAAKLLGLPGMPSFNVSWHANGAIFTKPTIFGYANGTYHGAGEAGMEAALPIDRLSDFIWADMEKFIQFIPQIDYELLGQAVANAIAENSQKIVLNEREVGRTIRKEFPV